MAGSSRFVTLAFCVALSTLGGLQYMFGTFSVPIKDVFRLAQTAVDRGGLAQSIGCNFGLPAGMLLDRAGPRPVILAAGVLGFAAYLLLYACMRAVDLHDTPGVLYLILFLQGQAQLLADMAVVPTVSRRFQGNSGLVLGLCKSFIGLSGSIFEQVYLAFFKPDSKAFMVFIALYFPALCGASCNFVSAEEPEGADLIDLDDRRKRTAHVVGRALRGMPVLLGMLLFAIFSKGVFPVGRGLQVVYAVVIVGYTAALCVWIGTRVDDAATGRENSDAAVVATDQAEQTLALAEPLLPAEETALSAAGESGAGAEAETDFSLAVAMRGPAFWLQALAVCVAWGSGLMLIINIGQLCEIVGLSTDDKEIFVSLISVFNCIGRLGFGAVSDVLTRRGVPRLYVFGGAIVCMGLGMLVLSLATPAALYVATVWIALLYGGCNVLGPTILGDLFGVKHIGTLYSSMMLAIISGSYLIATTLFAAVYEMHATGPPGGADTCSGRACIMLSTHICAALCIGTGSLFLASHRYLRRTKA